MTFVQTMKARRSLSLKSPWTGWNPWQIKDFTHTQVRRTSRLKPFTGLTFAPHQTLFSAIRLIFPKAQRNSFWHPTKSSQTSWSDPTWHIPPPTRSTAGFGVGSGTAGQCWCQKGDPTSIPAPGNLNPGWKPHFTSIRAGFIFSLSREPCDCQSQHKERACIWLKVWGERRKSPFSLTGKSNITLQKLWHYRKGTNWWAESPSPSE